MNELTIKDTEITLNDLGTVLVKSGFFADTRDVAQAIVKVLAGRELGFGPIASMTGINIIKGRVSLSANLMASLIKRSGKYNYLVVQLEDNICELTFLENGKAVGSSKFTIQDAEKAGLAAGDNWRKYPRNMLFSRALSNGVKWYCPDISNGPLYTPDELGATVDGETGEVVTLPMEERIIEGTQLQELKPEPEPEKVIQSAAHNGKYTEDELRQAVVDAGLAENAFAAKGALDKCKTGWDTPEKAIAWMQAYREARELGGDPAQAAKIANEGGTK